MYNNSIKRIKNIYCCGILSTIPIVGLCPVGFWPMGFCPGFVSAISEVWPHLGGSTHLQPVPNHLSYLRCDICNLTICLPL